MQTGLQTQRAGQRDHRAIVGAEFQTRKVDAKTFALGSRDKLRAQAAIRTDATGDDQALGAGGLQGATAFE